MPGRLPSWLVVPLLAAPLLGLTAWVLSGALRPASTTPPERPEATGPLSGLPPPQADLPEARLEEQVDGAADALRAQGCRRLLHWRFENPPAEAELLVFRTDDGARTVMETEAGPERTPGPGEEAQATAQSLYFRRGAVLVRLFLDPGAPASVEDLLRHASEIDRALAMGDPL